MICLSKGDGYEQGKPIGIEGAVRAFRTLCENTMKKNPALFAKTMEPLRGKNLACWCKPGDPCHADVLLEFANRPEGAA